MLPQVIQRIFSVCKTDPNFPLKHKIESIDGEVSSLKRKTMEKMKVAKRAKDTRMNLMERIEDLEDRNEELKNRLLDFLGSD